MKMPDLSGNRRVYAIAGGAAAVYVGYRWWTARSAPAATTEPTSDTSSVTDTPGGTYGPGNVQYGGADVTPSSEAPATNAAWTQAAVTALVATGWDGAAVQAALGRYLTDQSLTTDQETIVRAAIAAAGNPPIGVHTIYHMPTPVTPVATKPKTPAGFHTATLGRTSAVVTWAAPAGATSYEVAQVAPASWPGESTTTTPHKEWTGLKPASKYTYRVRAISSAGPGPWSTNQSFTTKK